MKRSQALKLVLIGAPILTLAWCTSRPTNRLYLRNSRPVQP
ncbi:hypothetical protein Q3H58_003358 [Pseudomonas psychrotolerans]|nr:hypothetical protein [Pseudomonas psychrotolerans]